MRKGHWKSAVLLSLLWLVSFQPSSFATTMTVTPAAEAYSFDPNSFDAELYTTSKCLRRAAVIRFHIL